MNRHDASHYPGAPETRLTKHRGSQQKLFQAKLNGQTTERKKQRVESVLKQVGLDLFQVDQNEIQAEDTQTTLGTSFAFPVKDDQADRISSEFRAVGFVVGRIEWLPTQ